MRATSRRRRPDNDVAIRGHGQWRVKRTSATPYGLASEPVEVPDGKQWCEECRQVVRLRKDGTMQAHRTRSKVPCIAAPARDGNPTMTGGQKSDRQKGSAP